MATFLITALLVEYLVAWIFMSVGLTDTSSLTHVVSVPFTGWVFNVAISPLFHLVPLGVIVVLVSSWAYLLRQLVIVPQRIESRKSYPARRERPKPKRFKRFSTGVGSKLRGVGRIFKPLYHWARNATLRTRGISNALQRLFFARTAIRSATTVFSIFLFLFILLLLAGYPRLVHNTIASLYKGNPSFHGFVLSAMSAAQSTAQALLPIGWVASTVNNGLLAVAPGFRSTLEGLGTSVVGPLTQLDIVGKYVICQNIAAWFSAVTALVYGQRISSKRRYKSR